MVLVGVRGYGSVHLRELERLAGVGRVQLVGCADTSAPDAVTRKVLGRLSATWSNDYVPLIQETRPDIVVIATPPHIHGPVAVCAFAAGCHVLLEKPPVPSLSCLDELEEMASRRDLLCQVGFQSLGSGALRRLRQLAADGTVGSRPDVYATGHWQRNHSYWTRSPWAGRDLVGGEPVHDGALTNPFSHAVMNCLAIRGWQSVTKWRDVAVERYRANSIEVDDTAVVRVVNCDGANFTVAVTLCAEVVVGPSCVVAGERGSAVWRYEADEVLVEHAGQVVVSEQYSRVGLLEELVEAVTESTGSLSAPLSATRGFVSLYESIVAAPVHRVEGSRVRSEGRGASRTVVVAGIDATIEWAAREHRLLSEVGLS